MLARRVGKLISSLAVFTFIAACAPAPAPQPTGGTAPNQPSQPAPTEFKLRIGMSTLISTMDPHASIGSNSRRYGLYECLVSQDENGKLQPALATEWRNINPTTWQFKLAQGRKFHDGNPVTAEDVKYSYDRAINPENKLGILARTPTIDKVEIVDPSTINIITKVADPLLVKRAALVVIVEKSHVEKLGPAEFAIKAMGTGPYMQKEFLTNDRLVLVANPHYPTKPGASEITIRNVPEASARMAGLRTGELDIVNNVPLDQADGLKTAGMSLVNFNQGNSNGAYIFTNVEGLPTNNKLVRQALNYAVDKETIAKNIYKGYAKPEAGQVIQANTIGFNPNIKAYPYDPAKAKQLLAQAGYANGFKMKMEMSAGSSEIQAMFLLIQSQLKDVGIEAELNVFTDNALFLDLWYGRKQRSSMLSVGLLNSPAMDADFALVWFKGSHPEPQRFYNNPLFDEPYNASVIELNEARRVELLQKAVAAMYEDPPYLFLMEGFTLWAASPKLTDVLSRGDQEPRLDIIKSK